MKRRKMIILYSSALLLFTAATGCQSVERTERLQPVIEEYTPEIPQTCLVERGDLEPVFTLSLSGVDMEAKSYFQKYYDGMKVKKVYVAVGDKVSYGDPLVTFDTGNVEDDIRKYENRIEEDRILIEHLERMSEIDSEGNYKKEAEEVEQDIAVSGLYLEELKAKQEAYTVRAEGNGTVANMSDVLKAAGGDGTEPVELSSAANHLSITYGDGIYKATTAENYDFQVGQSFVGYYGVVECPVELIDIVENGSVKELTFRGSDERMDYSARSMINLTIVKETLRDALYVNSKCVFQVNDKSYVFTVDENNYRELREVVVSNEVDGLSIISEGLEEGEKVEVR